MAWTRRKFLITTLGSMGALAGAGTLWATVSERRTARWLRKIVEDSKREMASAAEVPDPHGWSDNGVTIAWLGHATLLINFYGFKILTDPALAPRVGVWLGVATLGPKRYIEAALSPKQLPAIDLVLLSHAHMDHMDVTTLRKLKPAAGVVTSKVTTEILPSRLARDTTELRWGEEARVTSKAGDLFVKAFEVKHWGQRWPNDISRGYNGYVLRRENKSLLFGGDTAMTPLFEDLRSHGPYEAAIMPIGAYRPWIRNHCTPEEALEMVNAAGAKYVIPVHHKTFKLSDEPMNEPIDRLKEALKGEPERLALENVGQTFRLPA